MKDLFVSVYVYVARDHDLLLEGYVLGTHTWLSLSQPAGETRQGEAGDSLEDCC